METEKGQITRIYNGEIITPERNFGVGTVLIAEGKIIGIEPGNYEVPGSIGHDAHGGYIAPGFIDLHTHGAGDSDFMDCTEEDCLTIAREHLRHGTTLLYPTTLASDNQELFRFLDIYDRVKDQRSGAAFGGLHLEGPYFAYAFRIRVICATLLPKNTWRYWTGAKISSGGALLPNFRGHLSLVIYCTDVAYYLP